MFTWGGLAVLDEVAAGRESTPAWLEATLGHCRDRLYAGLDGPAR